MTAWLNRDVSPSTTMMSSGGRFGSTTQGAPATALMGPTTLTASGCPFQPLSIDPASAPDLSRSATAGLTPLNSIPVAGGNRVNGVPR